jgi:hypothetical protein
MLAVLAAQSVLAEHNPDAVLFLERGYTPYGEFFDLALTQERDVLQWCGSHNQNFLTLKRYSWDTANNHPSSVSDKTWQMLKAMPWGEPQAERVRKEVFQNYASGQWYSEVGTQFNKRMFEKRDIMNQLGLDPAKKTAIVFPHLFWDATFFYGVDLFTNYREWFLEVVKAACKNTRVNWILKLHPANVVKLKRDGYEGELVELSTIREHIGTLPPHVKILKPDSPINTYSLFSIMDYCLTVRGTIGIEAALYGKTVLTAGTGRYEAHGFTIDSVDRSDYLEKLARLETLPAPTREQTELAEKFAYGTFVLRPFPLVSLRPEYRKDATASLAVDLVFDNDRQLNEASDVKAFAAWAVDSRDSDYLQAGVATPSLVPAK